MTCETSLLHIDFVNFSAIIRQLMLYLGTLALFAQPLTLRSFIQTSTTQVATGINDTKRKIKSF